MFADKSYLLLLILMPLLILFFYIAIKKRKDALNMLIANINLLSLSEVNLNAYKIKSILFLIGIFFIILALARPQYGNQNIKVVKESTEIVLALDVSKSMLAQDFNPNRLEKAKSIVLDIVTENPGEKMGVIVFSGDAMWQCPMTYDLQALKIFLEDVNVGVLPSGGTQVGNAIILACKALNTKLSKSKVMFLISDGEDHDSKINEAISIAKKVKLKIICVAIGSKEGSPIPVMDNAGKLKDYVRDSSGQVVVSKVNSELLQKIAQETGGKFFDASQKNISYDLVKTIKTLVKSNSEVDEINNKIDRFQIFVLAGLIFLIGALIYPVRRKR
ncbi:MAG: VWA domain-containing protein [Endomicrobium sp.]|jgi:Ca-activated chloride channel family protein|nr:VWA domain-containing protein [Endomicrobium sp.]